MTPEQRASALEKAKAAGAERKKVKDGLKSGELTLAGALRSAGAVDAVGKMKVSALLQALPGVGKVKAAQVMKEIGIPENRRLRGLGERQRAALEQELAPVR
jgi:signal recognition particle GTPase